MDPSRVSASIRKCALPAFLLASAVFALFPGFPNALRWPGRFLFFGALAIGFFGLTLALRRLSGNPKRAIFSGVALLLGSLLVYGFLELVAFVYLKSNPDRNANPFVLTTTQREAIGKLVQGEPDYTTFDPTLGWAIKPHGVSADGRYRANGGGFRADREYTPEKPAGVSRVICFGDSYTHGNSVANDETWPHSTESRLGDGWEVLNFGVGAFGMAQAYLRYREFKEKFEADVVVIGCMSDNIRRTVNVYYPFRLNRLDATTFALAKPWASRNSSGNLVLHPNPLPSLQAYEAFLTAPEKKMRQMARKDLLFEMPPPTPLAIVASEKIGNADFSFFSNRRNALLNRDRSKEKPAKRRTTSAFSPDSEIFRINARLFEEFVEEIEATGATPLILWFPSPKDVARFNDRGTRIYQSFLDFFEDKELPCVDALTWLDQAYEDEGSIPAETVFFEGHYAPRINRLIGDRLAGLLGEKTP